MGGPSRFNTLIKSIASNVDILLCELSVEVW